MKNMKVLAINGSPRKKGNTAQLMQIALDELEREGIKTEMVRIGDEAWIGCQACFTCRKTLNNKCKYKDDPFNKVWAKCLKADAIILGSPVYVGDMTSAMKAFIERACIVGRANNHALKRKPGAAVVAVRRNGGLETFNAMNNFFTISQMIIVGSSYWNQGVGKDIGDIQDDEEGIQTMKTLGQNMAWLLKKLA